MVSHLELLGDCLVSGKKIWRERKHSKHQTIIRALNGSTTMTHPWQNPGQRAQPPTFRPRLTMCSFPLPRPPIHSPTPSIPSSNSIQHLICFLHLKHHGCVAIHTSYQLPSLKTHISCHLWVGLSADGLIL